MKRFGIILLLCIGLPLWGQEHACTDDNRIGIIHSGREYLSSLLEDISSARESIEMEYYWFSTDSAGRAVRDALIRKAQEGVRVRILFDNMVTPFARVSFYDTLRKAGAEVHYVHDFSKMGPFRSLGSIFTMRDHRKIVVIDRRIAYTGGMNLCMESIRWKDTQVRVEGPAAAVLLSTFRPETEIPEGTPGAPLQVQVITSEKEASMESLYVRILDQAKDYFYIQTPYFCPPKNILTAMKAASARGVDVRIILPERSDWGFMNEISRDHFEDLLSAGIGVFLYDDNYDHTKSFVCDDSISCIGSMNLDNRSFHINKEVALFVYDNAFSVGLAGYFRQLQTDSFPVRPGDSVARGIHKPYRAFLRALSPLF